MKENITKSVSSFTDAIEVLDKAISVAESLGEEYITETILANIEKVKTDAENMLIDIKSDDRELINRISDKVRVNTSNFMDDNTKYFLICESVYKAAELIRIGENFTARTVKDIKFGNYTYLMGKHQMVRFICGIGGIKGIYYNNMTCVAFEFGLDIDTGEYYAPKDYQKEFSMIMQIMAFVELGDIEVIELAGGRNNGKSKNDGKITNTSNNTVFVVDSSWNKLIIRTDGFAVRGHFRLQPCGMDMADRKLIWINAFEKHGYTRRPKAEIVR